jgi:hypothetical protein
MKTEVVFKTPHSTADCRTCFKLRHLCLQSQGWDIQLNRSSSAPRPPMIEVLCFVQPGSFAVVLVVKILALKQSPGGDNSETVRLVS